MEKSNLKQNLYYLLIGITSLLSLLVMPLLGTEIDVGLSFPSTTMGWVTWSVSRVAVAALNVLIFHCFIKQADLNTAGVQARRDAEIKLNRVKVEKGYQPKSPERFYTIEYCSKIPSILITTLLSLVAFGPVILNFDLGTFITYATVIVIGVIFGVIEMKKVEQYLTVELPLYAEVITNADNR